jgi:hypothetical protein
MISVNFTKNGAVWLFLERFYGQIWAFGAIFNLEKFRPPKRAILIGFKAVLGL